MAIASSIPMHRRLIPRSLQSRLLVVFLAVILLSQGVLVVWLGLSLQGLTIEQAEHDLELEAAILASLLSEPSGYLRVEDSDERQDLENLITSFITDKGVQVSVLDTSLQIVVTTNPEIRERWTENDDRPELVAALNGTEEHDVRKDAWQDESYLFAAISVFSEQRDVIGVVQFATPMGPVNAEIIRGWIGVVAAGAVVVVVTAFGVHLVTRRVAEPIQNLTAVTRAMAGGDLNQRATPSGPEEFEGLAQDFNRMADRVHDMMARQQAFVSDAAHELRSPLAGARLRIEMLQQHGRDKVELTQQYLPQLLQDMDHLQRLVDHLLALSRLDQGYEMPVSMLDLAPLLYELTDEMRLLFRAADVTLDVEVPPHLPLVSSNAEAIRMVIRNLLDNTIQHTGSGGRVALHAEAEDGMVMISVADTGQGIPSESLPHVFDRFYRVDKARTRKGGAGLGLSLVRRIAEAHGGHVFVKSHLGQGTTFTVRLPAGAEAPRSQEPDIE